MADSPSQAALSNYKRGSQRDSVLEPLQPSVLKGHGSTVDELETDVRAADLENDPEILRDLKKIRNCDKIIQAAELMTQASELLLDVRSNGEEMEIEAVRGFLQMAQLAVEGLCVCNESAIVAVAPGRISWPVMMEIGGTEQRKIVESKLKRIKLGCRSTSNISGNALVWSPSLHKFVVTMLYAAVAAIHADKVYSKGEKTQPIRIKSLRAGLGGNFGKVVRLVHGYDFKDWRKSDLDDFRRSIKELRAFPEVTPDSFNAWFAACRALLVCITKDEFHLPRHNLHGLGQVRAWNAGGDDVFDAAAAYREGIVEKMKSALQTVLRVPRKKQG